MTVKVIGLGALETKFYSLVNRAEKRIVDLRKSVAKDLLEALMDNVPVWSGKTIRSLAVGNDASGGNAREPHPDRRDYSKDGEWENHIPDWGDTKNMPLGREPNRSTAEAVARASVEQTNYSLDVPVFVSSDSYMWDIIENASYRGQASRNTAVVSQIAIAQIKSKYGGVIK
jgi:hypothetical protein